MVLRYLNRALSIVPDKDLSVDMIEKVRVESQLLLKVGVE